MNLIDLNTFKNWALAQGSVAKFNDGQFLGECVSLINQYCYRVLGIPADAWGDAKDWAVNATPLSYFDVVSSIQPGDILVYGPNFGSGRGHIEIALGGGQSLFQNRNGNRRVGSGSQLPGYYAILRPKKGVNVDQQTQLDQVTWKFNESEKALRLREEQAAELNKQIDEWKYKFGESEKALRLREQQSNDLNKVISDLDVQLKAAPVDTSEAEKKLQAIKEALDIK